MLDYTRREMWLRLPRLAMLFAFPLIEGVSRFAGQPREFYPELATVNFDRFIFIDHIAHRAKWGASWDAAHLIYLYLVIGLSLALLLIQFFRTKAPFRTQAFLLAIGPLFLIVTDLLDIGDGTQLHWMSATVFGYLALELLYASALFRYRLFDIVPIARDLVIESMDDAVLVLDDQFRLVDVNPAAQALTGRARRELIGQPLMHILPALPPLTGRELRKRAEIVLRVGDGERHIAVSEQPVLERKGRVAGHVVFLQDIGELEQAKQAAEAANAALSSAQQRLEAQNAALQASEQKYRFLVENLEEGVWALDAAGNTTFVNRRMAEMLGYAEEDMLGKHLFEFMGEQAREEARQLLARRSRGITDQHEFEFRRRDGTPIYTALHASPTLDDRGNYLGALAGVTDISQRREMEEALRQSEAMFRTLAEQSPNTILIFQRGHIVYANPRCAAVTGYTLAELKAPGFDYSVLIAPEDLEAIREVFRRHTLGEEAPALTCRFVRRAGNRLTAIMSTRLIDYEGERGVLATITDISQLKQAEERRATLYRMSEDISTSIDVREICVALHNAAAKLMLIDIVAIALRHDGTDGVVNVYHHDPRMTWSGERHPDGPCLASHVISTGQSLRVKDVDEACVRLGLKPDSAGSAWTPARAALAVPLLSRGRVIGMIAIESNAAHEYSATDQEFLEILAAFGAAAFENARLHAQAQALAVAEERSRLARDLHDSVTQTLYSVALTAEALPRVWEQHPAEARAALTTLHRQARGALGEMRVLLLELRPAILLEKDLSSLLRQLADVTMGRSQTVVEINVCGVQHLPDDVCIAVYRIVQEALNNVARHARAGRTEVDLDFEREQVSLRIQDDGIGFDTQARQARGCGLQNMTDRAREIGAEFALQSEPGRGTRIELVWRDRSSKWR